MTLQVSVTSWRPDIDQVRPTHSLLATDELLRVDIWQKMIKLLISYSRLKNILHYWGVRSQFFDGNQSQELSNKWLRSQIWQGDYPEPVAKIHQDEVNTVSNLYVGFAKRSLSINAQHGTHFQWWNDRLLKRCSIVNNSSVLEFLRKTAISWLQQGGRVPYMFVGQCGSLRAELSKLSSDSALSRKVKQQEDIHWYT